MKPGLWCVSLQSSVLLHEFCLSSKRHHSHSSADYYPERIGRSRPVSRHRVEHEISKDENNVFLRGGNIFISFYSKRHSTFSTKQNGKWQHHLLHHKRLRIRRDFI